MKKFLFFLFVLFISSKVEMQAQNVLDGVYVKEHNPTRQVIPYAFLREADVLWAKRVWEVIDLKQKINLPLRFPREADTKDRKSLIEVIMDAIDEGSLTAYNTSDDEFTTPMTLEEFKKIGGAGMDTIQVTDPEPPYLTRDSAIQRTFSRDKVIAYRIKEDWFFDKQRSVMECRIIGIAPLMLAEDEYGNIREGNILKPLFWIYYPEARKLLANAEAFNRGNDTERRTFDDIFHKRMFNSYIIKESNVYNRRIEDYKTGLDALLEAEKIKSEIVNLEHDMWEY
jgi:gliding motility associated protien GldN